MDHSAMRQGLFHVGLSVVFCLIIAIVLLVWSGWYWTAAGQCVFVLLMLIELRRQWTWKLLNGGW